MKVTMHQTARNHKVRSRKENQSTSKGKKRRGPNQDFNGIHRRRDKRFMYAKPADAVSPAPAAPEESDAAMDPEAAARPCEPWREALMLWLSWNKTYEKVTERMYREHSNQEKLQDMMDEMDQLRWRAVNLAEQLVG